MSQTWPVTSQSICRPTHLPQFHSPSTMTASWGFHQGACFFCRQILFPSEPVSSWEESLLSSLLHTMLSPPRRGSRFLITSSGQVLVALFLPPSSRRPWWSRLLASDKRQRVLLPALPIPMTSHQELQTREAAIFFRLHGFDWLVEKQSTACHPYCPPPSDEWRTVALWFLWMQKALSWGSWPSCVPVPAFRADLSQLTSLNFYNVLTISSYSVLMSYPDPAHEKKVCLSEYRQKCLLHAGATVSTNPSNLSDTQSWLARHYVTNYQLLPANLTSPSSGKVHFRACWPKTCLPVVQKLGLENTQRTNYPLLPLPPLLPSTNCCLRDT